MNLLTCSLCPLPKNTLPPWCRYLISDQSILQDCLLFFFFQPLPVTSSNNSHCSKHSLIHWIQGSTLDSSFRAIHYHDWSDFSRMTAKWKPQEEGRINFGVIPQISLHFRVIKASSYKPGNTNRAVAGTLQQCKLQALWLTQIYGGTPLPSNPQ